MFKKIVVGVDGSDRSHHALRLACELAAGYDSELHLVHTPQPQTVAFALGAVSGYHTATMMPSNEEVQEAADKILDAARDVAGDMGRTVAATYNEIGDPAEHIVACAKACGADLIVTGRRGLGSVGALLQGSTSQRVNHLAECACLSVI